MNTEREKPAMGTDGIGTVSEQNNGIQDAYQIYSKIDKYS